MHFSSCTHGFVLRLGGGFVVGSADASGFGLRSFNRFALGLSEEFVAGSADASGFRLQ